MKRITLLGCFVGLLSLTMNAQISHPSSSDLQVRTTNVETQSKPEASIQDLLQRYQSLGKKSGSISEYFTKEEQRKLREYVVSGKSLSGESVANCRATISSGTSPEIKSAKDEIGFGYQNQKPLFLSAEALYANGNRGVSLPSAYYNATNSPFTEDATAQRNTSAFLPQNVMVPFTGTYGNTTGNRIASLLYDNGNFINQPGNPDLSVLQGTTLGMNTLGAGAQFASGNSVADEVVFAQGGEITSIDTYTYQTGTPAPSITGFYLRVWNGDPSLGTATVVWGDMVTNIIGSNTAINAYRVSETSLSDRNREIQKVTGNTPGLTVAPGTYWFEYSFQGSGTSGPWAVPVTLNGQATTGNALQNLAGAWQALLDTGTNTPQGLPFQLYGTFSGGGGTFPEPYCGPLTYNLDVEPITLVDVAGISNRTSEVINGTPAHEDFTTIVGNMEAGESYAIALEGNTSGGFTCSFTVFIDWNQDGLLDNTSERYEIGTINSSTGNDGIQATGTIAVPADALAGPTRMRVMKRFGSTYAPDSCTGGSGYGQAEDYTIEVATGGGGGGDVCSQSNPNNGFENAFTSSNDGLQIIATDINVPADMDFTLNTITVNVWGAPGSTIDSANIVFYDNAGGVPGASRNTQTAVAPSSQTVIGTSFGFDVTEAVFTLTPEMLEGQDGSEKVYWVSLYFDMSSGSGYLGASSVIVGLEHTFSPDAGATWSTNPGWDSVYIFDGICEDRGGDPTPGPLTTVYGIDNAAQDLIGFGTSDPQNAEIFGTSPITVNFENAGAIDAENPTTGYVLDNGGQFFSFDVTTGFYTALGSIPGDWVGMEYDRSTGILYAIKNESLYTIDPIGVTATLVGSFGLAGSLSVSLAIDNSGTGYIHELADDLLYSVNLATGAATLVGATGFDANFGQGMCYDPTTNTVYMSAFNNSTFMAEWRSVDTATGMTTLIGPITTVNDPAPQVAWASVGETLDPPACPKPTFLTVTDITETTAVLNWVAEPNAGNGYIWYVFEQGANPMTDTPVATGTTPAGTTTATVAGLENATSYDFYVVADCAGDGLSSFAGPVTFATLITPPACGGKFYDTGGPDGNYSNNENVTTVIMPEAPGDFVTVTFTMFNVESTWDALYVYDGPDTSYPLISSGNPPTNGGFPAGGYYGNTIPGPFSSTDPSGALTFVFRSEGSVTYAGWEADVTCAMYPPPNDKIVNSIDVAAIGFPYTDPAVRMPAATPENGNPGDCDLTGAYGVWYHFTTTAAGTANANIVTPAGASNVTFYTAPSEGSVETDLIRVQQSSNPCNPGTSSSISTEANQTYYVFVMNSEAVTDIQIDVTTLGVADNILGGFTYYPNPTSDILNLSANKKIEMVSLYNLLGQKILTVSVGSTASNLNLAGLATGTYVLKVTIEGQVGTYKIIKN